jgi:hypothetical protein
MEDKMTNKEWNLYWFKGYSIAAGVCLYGCGIIALIIHWIITENHILLIAIGPLCISCPFITKWLFPIMSSMNKRLRENI